MGGGVNGKMNKGQRPRARGGGAEGHGEGQHRSIGRGLVGWCGGGVGAVEGGGEQVEG